MSNWMDKHKELVKDAWSIQINDGANQWHVFYGHGNKLPVSTIAIDFESAIQQAQMEIDRREGNEGTG